MPTTISPTMSTTTMNPTTTMYPTTTTMYPTTTTMYPIYVSETITSTITPTKVTLVQKIKDYITNSSNVFTISFFIFIFIYLIQNMFGKTSSYNQQRQRIIVVK